MKTKNFDKFLLLIWKNLLLRLRRPTSTAFEFLFPVLICIVLRYLLRNMRRESHDQISYNAFRLTTTTPINLLLWSPCANPALSRVMQIISVKRRLPLKCLKDSRSLENALQYYASGVIVGVQFEDSLAGKIKFNNDIKISLRFPEDIRMNYSSWMTNSLLPIQEDAGPREPNKEDGGTPDYYQKGFLTLQNDIYEAIIGNGTEYKFPEIQMRRFPYPAWTSYLMDPILVDFIIIFLLAAMMLMFGNILRDVAIEKETQIKEIMKIMGLTNWLHWTAWFVSSLLIALILMIIVVIMIKIPVFGSSGLFPGTSVSILLLFFVLYACAVITCAFAVSVFFSKSQTATIVGGLYFFLSFYPYSETKSSSLSSKISACLFFNTAFGHGIKIIVAYENLYEGLKIGTVFAPVSSHDSISIGLVMIMFIIDTILHLLITLYVEVVLPGEYGVPNVWYFPFMKKFWCRVSPSGGHDVTDKNFIPETNIYEEEPPDIPIGIRILRLRKKFGKSKVVVRNVSFNILEGEITVLVGHNGAGKTTLMSILTGILPPTSGTAIINGYDIRKDMIKIRESLGFCPQQNILFDCLTVREHLYFFSKLKGMDKQEAKNEVNKYIEMLDLTTKRQAKTSTLSGGMKRRLCVAIALCGDSKICIFDEPTAGLDPTARRKLWDIMQGQKKGRTVLLSTHFMDEADVLGDRIAILANGVLQCYGSSFFLKKEYGTGYRLIIVKLAGCDVTRITKLLSSFIPGITIETDAGFEVTYVLPEEKSYTFEAMLRELERNIKNLKIDSYGVSLATMAEVFMKVGLDGDQDDDMELKKTRHFSAISQLNVQVKNSYLRGFALYKNQLIAMTIKKGIASYRSWILLLVHFIIPIGFAILFVYFILRMKKMTVPSKLDFTLDTYSNPIVVITTDDDRNVYYNEYKELLKQNKRDYRDWGPNDMNDLIIKETKQNTVQVRSQYIIGAEFLGLNNTIIAWFNNEYLHTPPLALQYVMNSVINGNTGPNYSIQFSNDPAPRLVYTDDIDMQETWESPMYGLMFSFCMSYVAPYFAIFCVRERVCKSKHLQFVSGTAISAFWLIAFAWDYAIYLTMSACILIVLICFQAALDFSSTVVILVIFGFAMLPIVYLISFFFRKASSAYTGIQFICMFLGGVPFWIIFIIRYMTTIHENTKNTLHAIFLIVPHYALASGIHNISSTYGLIKKCDVLNKLYQKLLNDTQSNKISNNMACRLLPDMCCDTDYYSSAVGIGIHIYYMMIVGVISFFILLLIEYRVCDCLLYVLIAKTPSTKEADDDIDVLEEKSRVQMGEITPREYKVVLKNMSKYYRKVLAVNQLCLGVREHECFGLLGVNGAGKTTTFKMLIGEVKLSYGNAWICGLNIRMNVRKIHKRVGYCPQFDALLEDLTGRETLIIYCLLRGIRMRDCKQTCEQLAREFQFSKHLDKRVKNYSGGNRRKLSTALALIGEPSVLFLDEPSTGMDPATKRYLWSTLRRIRNNGKCIILITHNMEECEAICTRVAIMVNGVFKCLGSPQHLKNKFADGYILIIKIRRSSDVEPQEDRFRKVDQFVQQSFWNAEKKETQQTLVTYVIKDVSLPWSKIFGIMENAKKRFAVIEDYSVSQFDLEQIFLHFTKLQAFVSE